MSSPGSVHARGALPPAEVLRARAKAAIRKSLRGLRMTTPASACALRSQAIVAHLEGLPWVLAARTVALFWPIEDKHEVDLRPLDASLRARGVRVAYPTVIEPQGPDSRGDMIFRFVDDPAKMIDHPLGFRAPDERSPPADELDLIVIPAIALDPCGQRIGYGAGFYDQALPSYPRAVTAGVAFDFQLIPEVATTGGDVPVQWIVTDRRVMQASADAALAPRRP